MDGVIVDSEPIESLAWEKVLAEYKRKPVFNSSGLVHEVGEASFSDIIERHNLLGEDLEVIRVKKRGFFEDLIKNFLPIPGTKELVKELKKQKLKLAIASSRNERQVKLIIKQLGLENKFNVVVGFSEKVRRKPFPDIFLKVSDDLGLKPSLCVVIEDSGAGVIAGKSAGMKVIAIPNKYTKHQDFAKADKIVNSLSEITMSVLESLGQ
jgi:HAD superfamily hydrolase (TIGR01509 family)